jgi:hypothetical protein
MRKTIIPVQEIQRNNRVKELMSKRVQNKQEQMPLKLTESQMEEVKRFMKEGATREEAVKAALAIDQFLMEKERQVQNWNKGGFVNEEKYKQPIKHNIYKK